MFSRHGTMSLAICFSLIALGLSSCSQRDGRCARISDADAEAISERSAAYEAQHTVNMTVFDLIAQKKISVLRIERFQQEPAGENSEVQIWYSSEPRGKFTMQSSIYGDCSVKWFG